MNIEERHSALAESVQLLSLSVHELTDGVRALTAEVSRIAGKVDTLTSDVQDLVKVARFHEGRIRHLEDRP